MFLREKKISTDLNPQEKFENSKLRIEQY